MVLIGLLSIGYSNPKEQVRPMQGRLMTVGYWLAQHQSLIRRIQWVIIITYIFLIIIPPLLPLPDESATLFHHLTVFAGFLFWGIWWPFVLLSIILLGRIWCGLLCPEGSLSEIANQHGRSKTIPRWIRWSGWPFVTFALTTIYGQMISVYQYPKPVLLILGGSTVAAIIIGYLYGKSNRVWCKYLCPVTGVFSLLAKLAPWRYKPLAPGELNSAQSINSIRCPTLLPLTKMTSAANCLMCGKCAIAKNAIQLASRSTSEEIVIYGDKKSNLVDSLLIIFGLCGLAIAAFQWTNSFWFSHFRELIDSWFLAHNIMWVFNTDAPWWLLTHYPEQNDIFSWIYGAEMIAYIVGVGLCLGLVSLSLISLATTITGRFTLSRFNHLCQAFIPLGGCSVFIGLLANTFNILQKYANMGFLWGNHLKALLLFLATVWSTYLAYRIIKRYTASYLRQIISLFILLIDFAMINYTWILLLHIWAIKSDSIAWNTLWVNFF